MNTVILSLPCQLDTTWSHLTSIEQLPPSNWSMVLSVKFFVDYGGGRAQATMDSHILGRRELVSELEQQCSMVSASVLEVLSVTSLKVGPVARRINHIPPFFSEAAFGQSVLPYKINKNKHALINCMK